MAKVNWRRVLWLVAVAFFVLNAGYVEQWGWNHPRPCNPLVLSSCEP
jgi:hypothetical protein